MSGSVFFSTFIGGGGGGGLTATGCVKLSC